MRNRITMCKLYWPNRIRFNLTMVFNNYILTTEYCYAIFPITITGNIKFTTSQLKTSRRKAVRTLKTSTLPWIDKFFSKSSNKIWYIIAVGPRYYDACLEIESRLSCQAPLPIGQLTSRLFIIYIFKLILLNLACYLFVIYILFFLLQVSFAVSWLMIVLQDC